MHESPSACVTVTHAEASALAEGEAGAADSDAASVGAVVGATDGAVVGAVVAGVAPLHAPTMSAMTNAPISLTT
jgi:hypothetical protein